VGFGALPVRALLCALTRSTEALIAVQLLDGVANAIFGVVSILVAADRTRGAGRFNLAQGALATALGGAMVERYGYNVSFLSLGASAHGAATLLPERSRRHATLFMGETSRCCRRPSRIVCCSPSSARAFC